MNPNRGSVRVVPRAARRPGLHPGGRSALHAKDAHIILDTAATLGLSLPVFSVVAGEFDQLVAAAGGDLDHSALITLLESEPGEDAPGP